MSYDRILCLANSYKHDHRCVAGISLITKHWVRLIGRQIPGCLTVKETCYSDGKEAALLDVFEAELGERCGSNAHPEDVFVTGKTWQSVRRFDKPADERFLTFFVNKGPSVLQGYGDRIYANKVSSEPVDKSLELIQPDDLWWWIRDENGKRRNRALFRAGQTNRSRYDLAVTDPVWLQQLNLLPAGIYPHSFLAKGKPSRTYLTVSLSEPYEGFHYKLVAGVVSIPA
jgi:Dual OB-containing domain